MSLIISSQKQEAIDKQERSDFAFRANHGRAISGFGFEYNEMEFKEKYDLYKYSYVGVENSIFLFEMTSYRENEYLLIALTSLKQYMDRNSPMFVEVDYELNKKLFELVSKLFRNPESEEIAIELEQFIYESGK